MKFILFCLSALVVWLCFRVSYDEGRIAKLESRKPDLPQDVITPDSMMTMWGGQQTTFNGSLVLIDRDGNQWVPLLVQKGHHQP